MHENFEEPLLLVCLCFMHPFAATRHVLADLGQVAAVLPHTSRLVVRFGRATVDRVTEITDVP